jgi:hypothetical protein
MTGAGESVDREAPKREKAVAREAARERYMRPKQKRRRGP